MKIENQVKTINLILLLILYYFVAIKDINFNLFPVVVLLSLFFSNYDKKILKMANMLQFLILPFFLSSNGFLNELNTFFYFNFFKTYNYGLTGFTSFSILLKITFGILLLYFIKAVYKFFSFHLYLFNIVFFTSVAIWLWLTSLKEGIGVVILFYFISFFLRSLYSLTIIKLKKPNWSPRDLFEVASLFPFWLKVLPSYSITYFTSENEDGINQVEIFKKIVICFISLSFIMTLDFVLKKFTYQGTYLELAEIAYRGGGSIFEGWMCIFMTSLRFIIYALYLKIAMVVLFLNCLGYRMPLPIRSPYLATSFSDFFSRLFVYYGELTSVIFFTPLYRFFSFIKLKKIRQGLAVFLAVFNMALIFHISRDIYLFHISANFMTISNYFKDFIVYMIILASFISLSVLFEAKNPSGKSLYVKRPMYFILYSILIIFGNVKFSTLENKLYILKFLIGLVK